MLFLVDGYNVTRADEATRHLLPNDMRLALMRRLAARGRGLLGAGRIVVVWDKGHNAGDEDIGGVEAVFSLDGIADDLIVRMAETAAGPVTIVTADRELKSRVRERRGRSTVILPTSTLFESAEQTHAKRRPAQRETYGGLPKGHALITKELEDVWLSEEGPK
jgi:predicted RNA-binding protein with PIN domain